MKPILFNTEMVRAILEGRKFVTRRAVKFEGNRNPNWTGYIKDGLTLYNGTNEPCNKPAPYAINDVLYVRETWYKDPHRIMYKANYSEKEKFYRNGNPLFMPKDAARLFLKVTDVRVERLHDMTLADFLAEGIRLTREELRDTNTALYNARNIFREIWNSTCGKPHTPQRYSNTWGANPYVWVIEFEVISKEEALRSESRVE